MQIIKILLAPTIVFFINKILEVFFDIYVLYPWFDIPMHLIGGIAIGISGVLGLQVLQEKNYIEIKKKNIYILYIMFIVFFAAIFWELYEYIWDSMFFTQYQQGIGDTVLDMFLGVVGGIIVGVFYSKKVR
jgi:hypothetical protein